MTHQACFQRKYEGQNMLRAMRISALLLPLLSSAASAWFDMGHMTIAADAYTLLTPDVKVRIAKLLNKPRLRGLGLERAS
jgi:hypothetical protein